MSSIMLFRMLLALSILSFKTAGQTRLVTALAEILCGETLLAGQTLVFCGV